MSLSNNTESKNPAQRFFEWSSQDKTVKWYDKEAKQNVLMQLPFTFIVLDMLSTVKGFSDADGGGIWSNEVRDTRKDILTVRTKRGIKAQGLWKEDIKNSVEGARYCRSVYIAFKDDDGDLVIGNIQMQGSANSAWIEFSRNTKIYGVGIQITGSVEQKKGATTYYEPVFQVIEANEATIAEAVELDKELQEYLAVSLGREQEIVVDHDDDYTGQPDDWHLQYPPEDLDDREERAAIQGGSW
jgi:hypothetical protein